MQLLRHLIRRRHSTVSAAVLWLAALDLGAAFLAKNAAEAGFLPWEVTLHGRGDCGEGQLPEGCFTGDLRGLDWELYLQVLCSQEVPRTLARDAVLQALAHFSEESAEACPEAFAVTLLALYGSGAAEFHDQVIRFFPDGRARVKILGWDIQSGKPQLQQWTATLPAEIPLAPPFPPWKYPGILASIKNAQDLSQLVQLPDSARCDKQALEQVDCAGNDLAEELLGLLCSLCSPGVAAASTPSGLPCLYSQDLLDKIESVMQAALLAGSMIKPSCPHALLATIVSLHGRANLVQPETESAVYQKTGPDGHPVLVMHVGFWQVAQDSDNYFTFNVPMMSLAPFPMHTAMLRSARSSNDNLHGYDQAFLAAVSQGLRRRGVDHVVMPGDPSVSMWTEGHVHSLFLPVNGARKQVAALASALEGELGLKLGGLWRVMPVSPGLWQIGEEPFRFSPGQGIAFRVFCPRCVYVSLYFYIRDEAGESILPLAPWTPCRIPWRRVFPNRFSVLGGSSSREKLPMAADSTWLRRAQRPPVVWTPKGDTVEERCVESRARLLSRELPPLHSDPSPAESALGETSSANWRAGLCEAAPEAPTTLTPEFDLADGVHSDIGLFDLMRQREDSEEVGLRRFSDKVTFKTRLVSEGILVPKIHFMSNNLADVYPVLKSLKSKRFVAKPTHLAASSFVYVMKDGINLVSGQPTSRDEVMDGLREAWHDRHVDDWATESTPPGVIIEELIEPPIRNGKPGSTPDELKCQTFFGELLFCEWTFVQNMTSGQEGAAHFRGAHREGDRAQPSLGHEACGIPNFASKGYVFRDGSCFDCVEPVPLSRSAWRKLVRIVEKVAVGTDHIRIDVFITPGGEPVVNEANISFLKISKFPPELVEEMRRRWVEGYRAIRT
ncbi:unnamed protein product [Polarella glacialis]|uniref:Uncharacterized protein n=1 Tax=Polarella glacialis TaxID=89957 RepID=A0A813LQS5_POLGL|nr:unnamed protein product [Polarella glacialis]